MTTETKAFHTPAPWDWFTKRTPAGLMLKESGDHCRFLYSKATGQGFAVTSGLNEGIDLANACLIAQAPEIAKLLSAARHCLKSYEFGNSATEPAHDLADLIEKCLKEAGIEVKF